MRIEANPVGPRQGELGGAALSEEAEQPAPPPAQDSELQPEPEPEEQAERETAIDAEPQPQVETEAERERRLPVVDGVWRAAGATSSGVAREVTFYLRQVSLSLSRARSLCARSLCVRVCV